MTQWDLQEYENSLFNVVNYIYGKNIRKVESF